MLLSLQGEHELLDPVSDKFASKYGVNAPFHDFTDYNKQRSVSQLNVRILHALMLKYFLIQEGQHHSGFSSLTIIPVLALVCISFGRLIKQ